MSINIYIEETGENLDRLCDDAWELSTQIDALETWLEKKGKCLKPRNYVADIGFNIRKDAIGGGGTLSANSMKIMGAIGMDVYFSEYPSSEEE